ncbi:LysR family transcriptional regulator [Plastoroseomonas hellenica]|uniref:LysR family transcriptional regulator n=1 Tax=Plastoroseomonas hellenica TaxID=2687306 RepID=A0ABS5F8D0_9PROT|nr:LysR family transcriptional regulator [Plastoroseomonas hellenica]MBR0647569.1 LysR family transcriptional regulator [Plastoroseomonas hellenica]MBR0668807.1 LysR family transcriptional regulator [Plastoroseomonas hellenica]
MDLRRLRSFREVAAAGSLSRAADRMRLAQPALSRQVALLEAELGARLFDRHGRGMQLTEAGQALLDRIEGPLRQLEAAAEEVRALSGAIAGQVALGMMPTVAAVLAAELAQAVAEAHPGIALRIVEGYTGHLVEWLQRGATDATLLYGPAADLHLRARPVFTEELVLAGRPGSLPGATVTLAEAARHPLILPSRPHGLRAVVETAAAAARIALPVRFEADSFAVLKDLTGRGLGFAILPRSAIAAEAAAGRLGIARLHRPRIRRQVVLALPPGRAPGRATEAVLAVLEAVIRRHAEAGDWMAA